MSRAGENVDRTTVYIGIIFAVIAVSVFATSYVIFNYHTVDHQRYYQITGKFTKYDDGTEYWYHLKGHADREADSKREWDAMPVGSYILIEWQTWERNIR